MTEIRIKRVYETSRTDDGMRILVDRLWPRGIRKAELQCDLWAKEIAPSVALRHWFHDDEAQRWEEFCRRYREELARSSVVGELIKRLQGVGKATLLYASKNTERNNAVVLQNYLQK